MELSWKIALRVIVSDGGRKGFLLIFINSAVKYFVVATIMSVAVAVAVAVEVSMMSLWVNQETLFPMRNELVAGIQI